MRATCREDMFWNVNLVPNDGVWAPHSGPTIFRDRISHRTRKRLGGLRLAFSDIFSQLRRGDRNLSGCGKRDARQASRVGGINLARGGGRYPVRHFFLLYRVPVIFDSALNTRMRAMEWKIYSEWCLKKSEGINGACHA